MVPVYGRGERGAEVMRPVAATGRRLGVMAGVALLAACHATAPPPRVTYRPPPPPIARHAPILRGPSRYLASSWSFSVTESACLARTDHPDLGFSVIVGPGRGIALIARSSAPVRAALRRPEPAELRFNGPSGSWSVRARGHGQTVEASLPSSDHGLDDVLALLGGGQLSVRTVDGSLPGLNVPNAGVAGRDWFGCPRDRLANPAAAAMEPVRPG